MTTNRREFLKTSAVASGVAVLGIYLFDEPATLLRIASMMMIAVGIIGLKLID